MIWENVEFEYLFVDYIVFFIFLSDVIIILYLISIILEVEVYFKKFFFYVF